MNRDPSGRDPDSLIGLLAAMTIQEKLAAGCLVVATVGLAILYGLRQNGFAPINMQSIIYDLCNQGILGGISINMITALRNAILAMVDAQIVDWINEEVADNVLGNSDYNLPNQGIVEGDVEGAPSVDAGKQGKHVPGHPNDIPSNSQWQVGENGIQETQEAWENGTELPDGTRVWDTGRVVGQNGETGVRVHRDGKGNIHGYPVDPGRYLS